MLRRPEPPTPGGTPRDGASGSHWGGPCHFHEGELYADQLDPSDLIRPAVIAWTGCDAWWSAAQTGKSYYNCGTGLEGLRQPGFSLAAVRWLIDRQVLGRQGALGTDTFGPDPGTDDQFQASSLVLHRHRITLENLTGLRQLPPAGAWIVVGGPRNQAGSGSPATFYGLVP